MPDNTPQNGTALVTSDEVPYSGDTAQLQLVQVAFVSGAEGSRTVTKAPGDANGLATNVSTAAGAGATVGVVSAVAVTADQNGTLQQYLRGLVVILGAVTASPVANTIGDRLKALLAKLPALGTAGTPSTDVISVQGVASGTVMPVSLASVPSHAVTNAGTFSVQLSAGLPASSNVVGKVSIDQTTPGTTDRVTVGGLVYPTSTPVMSVGSAYVTGDYIGTTTTPQAFTSVARTSGGSAEIRSITISDKNTAAAVPMELWLFSATFAAPTDSAAWSISDADALLCVGVVPLTTDRWFASSLNKIYSDSNLGLVVNCAATSLYYAVVARGAPTLATGDLTICLGVAQQ